MVVLQLGQSAVPLPVVRWPMPPVGLRSSRSLIRQADQDTDQSQGEWDLHDRTGMVATAAATKGSEIQCSILSVV